MYSYLLMPEFLTRHTIPTVMKAAFPSSKHLNTYSLATTPYIVVCPCVT